MRILIFSDGHGDLSKLELLSEEFKQADLVLFGGDFAQFKKPETGLPYLERLSAMHDQIFGVTGNCDDPLFIEKLEEYGIGIEKTISCFNGLVLGGSGGALKFTGETLYERDEDDLVDDLNLVAKAALEGNPFWDNLILVIHNPPYDTSLDKISAGFHVGSKKVREFIERYQPLLSVSGHIHESRAIEKLGFTTMVNPGSLLEGFYAIAEVSGGGKVPFAIESIELRSV